MSDLLTVGTDMVLNPQNYAVVFILSAASAFGLGLLLMVVLTSAAK